MPSAELPTVLFLTSFDGQAVSAPQHENVVRQARTNFVKRGDAALARGYEFLEAPSEAAGKGDAPSFVALSDPELAFITAIAVSLPLESEKPFEGNASLAPGRERLADASRRDREPTRG